MFHRSIVVLALLLAAAPAPASPPDPGAGVGFDPASRLVRRLSAPPRPLDAVPRPGWAGPEGGPGDLAPAPREKIFGADDRYLINDTTVFPWRTACKVFVSFPNGADYIGSAVLIDDSHALTAAHVVYADLDGGWADSVEVIPGYDFGYRPYGTTYASYMWTFAGWIEDEDPNWDLALLELSSPVGNQTGWLGLKSASDGELEGEVINTAGYPGDLSGGRGLYATDAVCDYVTAHQIMANGTFDVMGGQSGSGVWLLTGTERHVVGVVAYESTSYNKATRITAAKYDSILSWMEQSGGAAELGIESGDTDLPAEVEDQSSGTVHVVVRNNGEVAAATEVDVRASGQSANGVVLGTKTVTVPAGGTSDVDIPVTLDGSVLGGGEVVLSVHVNANHAVYETDYTDNTAVIATLTMLPPPSDVALGGKVAAWLNAGELVRYRFTVPAGGERLRVTFKGSRYGEYEVIDANGVPRAVYSRKCTVYSPAAGEWEVRMQRPSFDRKSAYGFTTRWK